MIPRYLIAILIYSLICTTAWSVDIYVSPDGSGDNPGTIRQPFQTIAQAQLQARAAAKRGDDVTVYLREGTYYLSEPVVFTSADSGRADTPVTYMAYEGEEPVISGGIQLSLDWSVYRDGIFMAKTPAGLEMDQLFIDGTRQRMARYPNYDPEVLVYNGYAADAFSPERAMRWANPEGGYIHAMHKQRWGGYHYRITGKNALNEVEYEGGWQNNRQMGMHEEQRFVENIFEELDAPGEWFHDAEENVLYFMPTQEMDLDKALVEIASLPHLIEFQGTPGDPVRHVVISGLTFRHTTRTFMDTREPLLRSDWTIYRGGAVFINGTEDCVVEDSTFDQVGGNAVFVNNYNRRVVIRGCHIFGSGASGVCFVGSPDSVRYPLFEYHERQHIDAIDFVPGPKGLDFPQDCTVTDSLIHKVGVVEKQSAGVQVSMASRITISHCSIYDIGRAGINFSEGTFGGHLIEWCDVFDTVLETHDHGSFNSWGRDRYWNLEGAKPEQLPGLALIDNVETNVIRNSRWRCDHGWDIDLDDGSSNYEIYNNLMLNRGLKLREGFHREAYNNITVNNTLHPHVWYEHANDQLYANIWGRGYRPIRVKSWGAGIDRNFFMEAGGLAAARDRGTDMNSISGNPLFINPAQGDYRVSDESPAFEVGFRNFPMDQFGVKKPELKAIARTPELPELNMESMTQNAGEVRSGMWMGATVRELIGDEFSAFGVSKMVGGIYLKRIPKGSKAEAIGFLEGDLILRIDGKPMKTVAELLASSNEFSTKQMTVDYVRQQKEMTLNYAR